MTASVQNTRSALADHLISLTRDNAFLVVGRTGKKSHYQAGRTVLGHLYERVAANDTPELERGQVLPSAVSVPAIRDATGLSDFSVREALDWLDGVYIDVTRNRAREVADIRVPNLDQLVSGYKPVGRGIAGKEGDSVEDIRATIYDRLTEDTEAGAFTSKQAARTVLAYLVQRVTAGYTVMDKCIRPSAIAAATGLSEAAGVRKSLTWLHEQGFIKLTEATGGKHRYINAIEIHHTGKRRFQSRLETAPRKAVVRDLANETRTDQSETRTDEGETRTDITSSTSTFSPAQQPVSYSGLSDLEPQELGQSEMSLPGAIGGTSGGQDSLRSRAVPGGARRQSAAALELKADPNWVDPEDEYEAALPLLAWLWLDDGEPRVSLLRSRNGNRQRRTAGNSLKLAKVTGKEASALRTTLKNRGWDGLCELWQQLHDKYLDPAQPDWRDRHLQYAPLRSTPLEKRLFWMGRQAQSKGAAPYFWRVDKRQERIVSDEKLVMLSAREIEELMTTNGEAYDEYVMDLYAICQNRVNEEARYQKHVWNNLQIAAERRARAAAKIDEYRPPVDLRTFDPLEVLGLR